jgi:rod shape-determining protein MreC
MERLTQDTYTTRGRPLAKERRDGLVMFGFLFLSCALLVFNRLDLEPVRWLRWQVVAVVSPVLEAAAAPVGRARQAGRQVVTYVDALSEIEQLRRENQRLRGWEWRARELERKLSQVSALARTAEEIGLEFVTARIIADSKGPLATTILINVGASQGVRVGFAAVSGDGLIGHVVDAGDRAARVLLLDDVNSRVPVSVGPGMIRAIMKGEGGNSPRLTHLAGTPPGQGGAVQVHQALTAPGTALRQGDDVLTSGDEGLLPRGIKIGVVHLTDDGPRVVLAAKPQGLDFVSLLYFNPPDLAGGTEAAAAARHGGTTSGKLEPTSGHRRAVAPRRPTQ